MESKNYQLLGWTIFLSTVLLALYWCSNQSGPAGWLMSLTERLFDTRLVQISWGLTLIIVGLPGYLVKKYLDQKAWDNHLSNLPPPNIHESAKRSKYIKLDGAAAAAPAAAPVKESDLPQNQEEYIATCGACGHLFPARKDGKEKRCPSCGEVMPSSQGT
jgi:hypothetical protein